MKRFRESVKKNTTILHIKDHGAGSRVFKSNERKVSDILKHNSSDEKSARLFYRLCRYFEVKNVLELGTSLGIATHAMALSGAYVTTIEGSPEVQEFAKNEIKKSGITNVESICSTFADFLALGKENTYDLIYIDGHHDGQATINYFESCLNNAHLDTVFVLDDIYWSADMTKAWNHLCEHPQVTASVNLYGMGLLFLRKEQLQERFYIKL